MKANPKIFVVCGVHNDLTHTKQLLSCIAKQSYENYQTIIIDDGSYDGTAGYIRKNYPEIKILKGNGSLWWTGCIFWGVEEAIKKAQIGDLIFIINNDCIVDKDYLRILVQSSLKHNRAIVGSLILDVKNKSKIHDAGVQINWAIGKLIPLGPKNVKNLPAHKTIQDKIDTLSTKGTIYPIEVFQQIGNFDKKHLPHYVSDYEFACRAKRHGFKLLLSYKAKVYNDTQRTGFGNLKKEDLSINQFFSLLLNRKSGINIVDQWWFITLSCPNKYKLRNYLLLIGKFLYLIRYYFGLAFT